MQLDFKEIADTVNLLDFITKEFPEYAIDKERSDKSQTRIVSAKEEIDVYKGSKGWLYFNRTNPINGTVKDEGNIIQFLKVRYDSDFKQIINKLKSYLNNVEQSVEPTYVEKPSKTVAPKEWEKLLQPLKQVNRDYLKQRGIDLKLLESNAQLKAAVQTFTYINKNNQTSFITGFPLKNVKGELQGVELRRPPYKELSGKFTAPGSAKERAFWMVLSPEPKRAYLAESPLDLISHMQLKVFDKNGIYIATAGRFGSRKAIDIATILDRAGVKETTLLCDNDIHGQGMNISLASVLGSAELNNPTYLKVNVRKGENTQYIEAMNLTKELKKDLPKLKGFELMSSGTNYLSFKVPYDLNNVRSMITQLNRGNTKNMVSVDIPKAKDWNKQLVEKKKLNL